MPRLFCGPVYKKQNKKQNCSWQHQKETADYTDCCAARCCGPRCSCCQGVVWRDQSTIVVCLAWHLLPAHRIWTCSGCPGDGQAVCKGWFCPLYAFILNFIFAKSTLHSDSFLVCFGRCPKLLNFCTGSSTQAKLVRRGIFSWLGVCSTHKHCALATLPSSRIPD